MGMACTKMWFEYLWKPSEFYYMVYIQMMHAYTLHYNNNGVGLFPGHASLAYFFFCGSVSLPNIGIVATGDGGLFCCCTLALTSGKGGILSFGLRTGGAADIVRLLNIGDKGSELNDLTAEVGEICCASSLPEMSSYRDGFGNSYLFCLLVGDMVSVGDVGNGSLDVFCR